MLLKARDRWPTTARVYCHPLQQWPADAEIVEQVAVRSCRRRGAAIDLVLDRGRNNRSQIVFTTPNPGRAGGRPMIFWQTARTAQRARPGQRVPEIGPTSQPVRQASLAEQVDDLIRALGVPLVSLSFGHPRADEMGDDPRVPQLAGTQT